MRRDRVLYCAVAAALGIPFFAQAGTDPRLGTPQAMPDGNAATSLGSPQGQVGPGAGVMASNVNWVGPFFTINNGTSVVGSWTDVGNWSPQVVPGVGAEAGGTATFGSNGDLVGDLSILDTDVALSGLVLSAQSNVRIFSKAGGPTHTVSTGGGTLTLDAPVETLRMSPSNRPFFGSTTREVLDFSIGGGGNVVKTGVGSVLLTRASTNNQFFLRQGTVLLTDGAAVNGGGSPAMATHDDSVFGTGTLTVDGGTIRMVSQASTPVTFNFNHPIVIGPNGAIIQPGADSPQFNNDISGTGTLHMGYFGDVFYNHAMSYSGDTILDAGVFLHMIGDQAAMLNSNIKNWARLDFEAGTDSGNHDRLGDTKTMTMTGSGVNVNGGAFDFSEKWGTTALTQGVNTFTVYPNPGNGVTLTMDNLTSTNGALLFIRGVNLGGTTGTRTQVVVNNAPILVGGGGAAGSTTMSIVPFAYGINGTTISDPDGGGVGTASLITNSPTGLRTLDLATEYAGSISGSANAADNVRITGTDSVGGAKTINALVMSSSDSSATGTPASVTGAGAITVTSGVILNTMTGTSIANPLNFGATGGKIISIGTSNALPDDSGGSTANAITLSGAISGTGGLTVGGGGDTVLSGDSTYTGVTKINNGQVFLTKNVKADGVTPGPLGLSTTPIELRGATDNPTDPNSARFGTQDARLMNGTAGSISVDRDILATGQQSEFNDANGPVVGGLTLGNTLVLTATSPSRTRS